MTPQAQTPFWFDSSRPSMGDPQFVDGQVRVMLQEARALIFEGEWQGKLFANPREVVPALVDKWTSVLSPKNRQYVQTMSPAALSVFLRQRGLGTDDPPEDTDAPVKALVAYTLTQFAKASTDLHEGAILAEQAKFQIDAMIEDFVALIRGLDNPAD